MSENFTYNQYRILDREEPAEFLQRKAAPQLGTLQEIVDYGPPLLKRCLRESEPQAEDVVLLSVLLRQAIAMGDAIHLQLDNGAIYAANLPLRSLFEATLSMEWILTQGKQRWGRQFYVAELRKRLHANQSAVAGTSEADELRELLEENYPGILDRLAQDDIQEAVEKDVENVEDMLEMDIYRDINEQFEDHWKRKKRGWEPRWYEPGDGPSSIRAMAYELGHDAKYEILYSHWSETSHGARARPHFELTDEGLIVQPIRSVENFKQVFTNAVSFLVFRTYAPLLDEYRPDETERLREKYIAQWREAFTQCPKLQTTIEYN